MLYIVYTTEMLWSLAMVLL